MTKYHYDTDAADKAIGFIETFCSHTKGDLAGKPLMLEDWQKKIVGDLFGTKREDGLRRYRTAFIMIPRKAGKTTLAAAIGLYLLFGDKERGAEIISAANDRSQAGICFGIAKQMVLNNAELSKRAKTFRDSITNMSKGNYYKAISSDSTTKHGLNCSAIIYDELHSAKNRDLIDTLITSTGARSEPITIIITTAGYDRQSICYEYYDYAKRVMDNVVKDDSFYPCIYEAGPEDDIQSEETWKKANPNYGVSLRKEYMAREAKRAVDVPSYQNTFKRLMLNIWTDSHSQWISNQKWQECKGVVDYESLKGRECWAGLDLASVRDLTALVLVFPEGDGYIVLPFMFIPRDGAIARAQRDGVDYMTWIRDGHLIATEGDVMDHNFVKEKIKQLSKDFRIQSIAYDRWGATQLVLDLVSDGAPMSPFGQGFKSMSAPTKTLEALILGKNIIHCGNPCFDWQLNNVALLEDAAGNIKMAKNKSKEKIDAMIAFVMAIGDNMIDGDVDSVYESRGIISL